MDLENDGQFLYVGSVLASNASAEKDVNNRIKAAHTVYRKLSKGVFGNPGRTQTPPKLIVYRDVLTSKLPHVWEIWVLHGSDIHIFVIFHQKILS